MQGVTFPVFILSGKIPVSNEWLIIDGSGRDIILLKNFSKTLVCYMVQLPYQYLMSE